MNIKLKCPQCDATMTVGEIEDEVKCPLCRIPMQKTASEAEQQEEKSEEVAQSSPGQPHPSIKVAKPVNDFTRKPWAGKEGGRESDSADTPPASTRTITKTATPVGAGSSDSAPPGDSPDAAAREQAEQQKARLIIESARRQAEEVATEMLVQAENEAQDILQSADRQADAKKQEMLQETERKVKEMIENSKQSASDEAEKIKKQALHEAEEEEKAIRERAKKEGEEKLAEGEKKAEKIIQEAEKQAEEKRKTSEAAKRTAEEEIEKKQTAAEQAAKSKLTEAETKARKVIDDGEKKAAAIIAEARERKQTEPDLTRKEGEEEEGKDKQTQAAKTTTGVSPDQESDPQIKAQIQKQKARMDGYAKREARFITAGISLGMLILVYGLVILFTVPDLDPAIRAMTYGLIIIDIGLVGWLAMLIREHYKKGNAAIKAYQQRNAALREEKTPRQEERKKNGQKSVSAAASSKEKEETGGAPSNRQKTKVKVKSQNSVADNKSYWLDRTKKKPTPILKSKNQKNKADGKKNSTDSARTAKQTDSQDKKNQSGKNISGAQNAKKNN